MTSSGCPVPDLPLLWMAGLTLSAGFAQDLVSGNEWPRYGHDGALTSRSAFRGRLDRPALAWSCSVGGREWVLQLESVPGTSAVQLNEDEAAERVPAGAIAWPEPPTVDLDGSGTRRRVAETFHERWAKILPDVPGWQRVAWNQTWTDQKVCRLELFAYDQGFDKPRRVWQSDPPEDTIFQPLNIVADIDQDGVHEICVAAHYRVMIFEGTTGRKETELRYHQSRPYGWFGLADVDADGRTELVTLGDFQSHVDVLNYDPVKPELERLSVRWRCDLERNIEERRTWPQVGPHPVVDVTGDGQLEIVFNLFNQTGDRQWHTVTWNAATGQAVRDFPKRYLHGTADLDQDGAAELFMTQSDGIFVPAFGSIELVKLERHEPRVLWRRDHAAWATADLPQLGPTWSTTASQGLRHTLVTPGRTNARPAFLALDRSSSAGPPWTHSLNVFRVGIDGQASLLWQIAGLTGQPDVTALAESQPAGAPAAQVRLRTTASIPVSLLATNATARIVGSRPLGIPLAPPIAARLRPGGPVTILVEGAVEQVFAIDPPAANRPEPALLWRRPGRGMNDGSRRTGLLAADLDGDGGKEVVAADQDRSGLARLVAYRHDGSTAWEHPLEHTPGAPPIWNVGGLTFWWAGRFRSTNRLDLFVNTRRGLMHSDLGWLLDGRTGQVLWRQEKAVAPGVFSWGYAGIPPGIADLDGDGLEELVCLYPVCFWVADGRTGELRQALDLAGRKTLPAWAAYGEPIIHDFTGRGRPEVLLDSPYILALLDHAGTPVWHGPGRIDYPTTPKEGNAGQTTNIKHALTDIDGDGVLEIAGAGYGDGLRVVVARTGTTLWTLPAPIPTCARLVAADLDGREGDELLYVASNRLLAFTGTRSAGRSLWEWQGPAELSMPVVADVDHDGLIEVIVASADGQVHCLDTPKEGPLQK